MVLEKYIMSSSNPSIWIFVIEQSIRMNSLLKSVSKSKAVVATQLVNQLIYTVIMRNYDGVAPKNRCFISVIGYNHDVKELCSGWLKDLDENPLRYETAKEKQYNGNGGIIEVEVKQPVWIEVKSESDDSAKDLTLDEVKKILIKWIENQGEMSLPIIFNIMSSKKSAKDDFVEVGDNWKCEKYKYLQLDIYVNDNMQLTELVHLPFKLYMDGGGPGMYTDEIYRRFYEFNTLDADVNNLKDSISLKFKVLKQ